jgi:hypothetical protein
MCPLGGNNGTIQNKRNDTEVAETQRTQRSAPHTWEFDLDKNVSPGKS